MSNKKHNLGTVVGLSISAILVALAVFVFLNRQFIVDRINAWSFQPSTAIAHIEQRASMTDEGKFIFYATKPEVLDSSEFNDNCPRQEVGSPILGCYTDGDRIYVYNLTNDQLDGMEEVTATHELLHAVWMRTSNDDKKHLEDLLSSAYDKLSQSSDLKERMDYYKRNEPGQFANELHSILGTEVAGLGPELENYYNKFFNRANVLALHDKYSSFFKNLSNQADDLYTKMNELGISIDARSYAYNMAAAKLTADISDFNYRANNGQFSSDSQFASERSALSARSRQLEADRQAINNDITTYNNYLEQYQKLSTQLQTLNDSMDSYHNLDQAPSV